MIEHLMSSSLSGDHQGCAAGFIRLHVRGLHSHQCLIARVVVCATGAVHTDIFRSIKYLPNPVPRGALNPSRGQSARTPTYRPIESREQPRGVDGDACIQPKQASMSSGCIVDNSSPTGLWKDYPSFIPYVLKTSDTLTKCKKHLQSNLRGGLPRRFYLAYRPWPSRSCSIGWARISGKGELPGGAFSICC